MRICWAGSGLHNCLGSNVDILRSVCQNPQASVAHGKCFLGVISPVSPGLTFVVRRLRTLVMSYTSLTRISPERSLGSNASRKAVRVRDSTRLALIQHLSPPLGTVSRPSVWPQITKKIYQCWGRLVLSGVLLRGQYHIGKDCQRPHDATAAQNNKRAEH